MPLQDVDSWFALLAAFIEQHQEVHSPEAFVDLLNGFLRAQPRPHEEDRAVVKLDQVRNWSFGLDGIENCLIEFT